MFLSIKDAEFLPIKIGLKYSSVVSVNGEVKMDFIMKKLMC